MPLAVGTDRHGGMWEPGVRGMVLTEQGRCQHGAIAQSTVRCLSCFLLRQSPWK